MLLPINERALLTYFGKKSTARGEDYMLDGRVQEAEFDPELFLLAGKVKGSELDPYEVWVKLQDRGFPIEESYCTCPMEVSCKHAAALLFYALKHGLRVEDNFEKPGSPAQARPSENDSLPKNLAAWVYALDSARHENLAVKKKRLYEDSIFYLLDLHPFHGNRLRMNVVSAKMMKGGAWSATRKTTPTKIANSSAPYITDDDDEIANLFISQPTYEMVQGLFPDLADLSILLLNRILETGRCYWEELGDKPLTLGSRKKANLHWEIHDDGNQILRVDSHDDGDLTVIAGTAWWVNLDKAEIGQIELPVPAKAADTILYAPTIGPGDVQSISKALAALGEDLPIPVPHTIAPPEPPRCVPKLKLIRQERFAPHANFHGIKEKQTLALVKFEYANQKLPQRRPSEIRTYSISIVNRSAEDNYKKQLRNFGLVDLQISPNQICDAAFNFPNGNHISDWLNFAADGLERLKESGWVVEIENSHALEVVVPEEEWVADAKQGSDYWFSLNLGIKIDGKTEPLLPIIHAALSRLSGFDVSTEIEELNRNGVFYAQLKDGRPVALPFDRVKDIISVLIEFFNRDDDAVKQNLELTLPELIAVSKSISSEAGVAQHWCLGKNLEELIARVKAFEGIKPITPPANFQAKLRSYQIEGLSWLNFLKEFELGGILADDMGLGKTVQALAHIVVEKNSGRVNHPYLVVCPTSVLPNWLNEIEKFAPHLKVMALYGPDRAKSFSEIEGADIVVTTYAIVWRDLETLRKHQWQAVILDEAQYIKNSKTRIASAVGKLQCAYRLCLTGTPIENHLGELWSQFNFLMPGFLKDIKSFTKEFRTPIEKQGNQIKRQILAAKVRPFLLRRTKEQVANDLPEKTEIIKRVELEGAQRDLYETVRLAMYAKVEQALQSKGLAQSQIIVLDAMLKLRQVCCDPRLVRLPAAKAVQNTAKLELLIEMLEELIDEGKSILLFSQFTSMLDLIIPELNKRNINFVQIRGATKDRATPVKLFQAGEVKLFLLSLKAGGTGLNLTAADTVIHYDPWWNPSVENQATDRAHRIGQDKSVFVFKLIASGTIEERMLELQETKKRIAEGMYGQENALPAQLTAEDVEALFQPF